MDEHNQATELDRVRNGLIILTLSLHGKNLISDMDKEAVIRQALPASNSDPDKEVPISGDEKIGTVLFGCIRIDQYLGNYVYFTNIDSNCRTLIVESYFGSAPSFTQNYSIGPGNRGRYEIRGTTVPISAEICQTI